MRGYGGRLNIRPAFQREFIYRDRQRDEVIRTVRRNFPLNVMYWVKDAGVVNWEVKKWRSPCGSAGRGRETLETHPRFVI